MNTQGPDKENAGVKRKKTKKSKPKQKVEKINEKEIQFTKGNKGIVKGKFHMNKRRIRMMFLAGN